MRLTARLPGLKDEYVHTMALGAVQEWVVSIAGDSNLGAGNHPFHLHVNPFQVVAIGGSAYLPPVLGVTIGEYRDTLPLWQSSSYTIRYSTLINHCYTVWTLIFAPRTPSDFCPIVSLVGRSSIAI
jgi:FtsP/CotA-like multicopper oxidase with cupredoxin domain